MKLGKRKEREREKIDVQQLVAVNGERDIKRQQRRKLTKTEAKRQREKQM